MSRFGPFLSRADANGGTFLGTRASALIRKGYEDVLIVKLHYMACLVPDDGPWEGPDPTWENILPNRSCSEYPYALAKL